MYSRIGKSVGNFFLVSRSFNVSSMLRGYLMLILRKISDYYIEDDMRMRTSTGAVANFSVSIFNDF